MATAAVAAAAKTAAVRVEELVAVEEGLEADQRGPWEEIAAAAASEAEGLGATGTAAAAAAEALGVVTSGAAKRGATEATAAGRRPRQERR